jgi:hypothetical protein
MRRAIATADLFVSLPRGWTILGLALAGWGLVVLAIQIASSLFGYITAAL